MAQRSKSPTPIGKGLDWPWQHAGRWPYFLPPGSMPWATSHSKNHAKCLGVVVLMMHSFLRFSTVEASRNDVRCDNCYSIHHIAYYSGWYPLANKTLRRRKENEVTKATPWAKMLPKIAKASRPDQTVWHPRAWRLLRLRSPQCGIDFLYRSQHKRITANSMQHLRIHRPQGCLTRGIWVANCHYLGEPGNPLLNRA